MWSMTLTIILTCMAITVLVCARWKHWKRLQKRAYLARIGIKYDASIDAVIQGKKPDNEERFKIDWSKYDNR